MKFPIAFTSLICDVLVKQKPGILSVEDVVGVNPSSLNFSCKLFTGNHVPNIVFPKLKFLISHI